MPTYAYACTECDHRFEVVQSFTDDSLSVCPECEGRLRKVFNAVGVVFKGGGFYRTDSRGSSGSTSAPAAASSDAAATRTSSQPASSGSGSSGSGSSTAMADAGASSTAAS